MRSPSLLFVVVVLSLTAGACASSRSASGPAHAEGRPKLARVQTDTPPPSSAAPEKEETSEPHTEAEPELAVTEERPAPSPTREEERVSSPPERPPVSTDVGPVRFSFDSARLSREAKSTLDELVRSLEARPELEVTVEGHCDERGTEEYNLALGQQRAEAIRTYLIDAGIPAERVHAVSFGEADPAVLGSGEEAWAENRRGELVVRPTERTVRVEIPRS